MRIGLDRIDGYATPATLDALARAGGVLAQTEVIDLRALEARRVSGQARVLDVRGKAEYDLAHVPDDINTRLGRSANARCRRHVAVDHRDELRHVTTACGAMLAGLSAYLDGDLDDRVSGDRAALPRLRALCHASGGAARDDRPLSRGREHAVA